MKNSHQNDGYFSKLKYSFCNVQSDFLSLFCNQWVIHYIVLKSYLFIHANIMFKLKTIWSILVCSQIIFFWYAQIIDTSLEDKFKAQEDQKLLELQNSLQFESFESCDSMNVVLEDLVKKYNETYPPYYRWGFGWGPVMLEGDMATNNVSVDWAKEAVAPQAAGSSSSWPEFSSTNLQKAWVDEPEIIKTDGEYIYYYNQQEAKIHIIKTPLDLSLNSIDFDKAKVVSEIAIPAQMWNTQMFLQGNYLVIAWTRYMERAHPYTLMNRSNRTVVAVYNISNPTNPTLEKFHDLDGYVNNMRMIGNKLYLLTNLDINWWQFQSTQWWIVSVDMKVSQDSLPKVYTIDQNKNLSIKKTDCNQISYVLPSDETLKQSWNFPTFTMISTIEIGTTSIDPIATTVAFGQAWQIHMSEDSLYMVQYHWIPSNYYSPCPFGAMCIMPRFQWGWQYSLIHKFSLANWVQYEASNLVPWSLLTQYSMDEDKSGNFRILTSVRNPQSATSLYVFDDKLTIKWKLENIEPGEQFKASRYIEDKLYLVTFKQVDPLFVIDVANTSNPKIIGELKIPGFSTYLHPFWPLENNKQYLIWLGYSANDLGRQSGLQLSLYEVDYLQKETIASKCSSLISLPTEYQNCIKLVNTANIRVSQLDSISQWSEWSRSEALDNPRMFVMNNNNEVFIPMLLKDLVTWKICSRFIQDGAVSSGEKIVADWSGSSIESEFCEQIQQYKTTFAWLKSFKFDKQTWIKESWARDYQPLFNKTNIVEDNRYSQWINQRQLQQVMPRVWFVNDVPYMVNNDFTHFIDRTNRLGWAFINFDIFLSWWQVKCEDLKVDQCKLISWCEPVRWSPSCSWDVCTEIAEFQGCKSI